MGYISALIGILIVGGMIWQIVARGFQMRQLVGNGVPGTARVVRKLQFRGRKSSMRVRYLRYEFTVNGKTYSRKIAVSKDEFDRYVEGDPIEIVYVSNNPKISAAKTMVEMCTPAPVKQRGGGG